MGQREAERIKETIWIERDASSTCSKTKAVSGKCYTQLPCWPQQHPPVSLLHNDTQTSCPLSPQQPTSQFPSSQGPSFLHVTHQHTFPPISSRTSCSVRMKRHIHIFCTNRLFHMELQFLQFFYCWEAQAEVYYQSRSWATTLVSENKRGSQHAKLAPFRLKRLIMSCLQLKSYHSTSQVTRAATNKKDPMMQQHRAKYSC